MDIWVFRRAFQPVEFHFWAINWNILQLLEVALLQLFDTRRFFLKKSNLKIADAVRQGEMQGYADKRSSCAVSWTIFTCKYSSFPYQKANTAG